MYLVDFVYDGIRLSDMGCMVGCAVSSVEDSVEMGSVIEFETVVNHGSYISEIINADYKDTYTCTFDIFRKPCGSYAEYLTDIEVSWFMRWLNRKEYHKFTPIYDDKHSFSHLYMMGTFNEIKAITMAGKVIGFTLTFITNSPFSYLDYKPRTFEHIKTFTVFDESEEIGAVYPNKFVIKTYSGGNISLKNDLDPGHVMSVKNCEANEVLTFDCIHKVLTSSAGHPTLYNDFNYKYPRLMNTMSDKKNVFTLTTENNPNTFFDVTLEYNPIRKVGVSF